MDLEVCTKAPSVRFLGISDRRQIAFPQKLPGHKIKIVKCSSSYNTTFPRYTYRRYIYYVSGVHTFSRNL